MIFDINRIVILILIGALLYALYMYQQQLPLPSIPFISQDKKTIKEDETEPEKPATKSSTKRTKPAKTKKKVSDDDLISEDNMSHISLGSLMDLDIETNEGRAYKKASELNSRASADTFGSLLNEESENEDFFFQR